MQRETKLFYLILLVLIVLAACRREAAPTKAPSPRRAAELDITSDDEPAAAPAPFARFPGARWQQYATPAEAGWSPARLADARAYADALGSAAVLLVADGAVVVAWGDVERRFMAHSVRKGLLHALIGMEVGAGQLDPGATLAELGVDDREPLTAAEKQATVRDLLSARSGVYHPAAYEDDIWKEQRPARGSHAPGSFWYYNNWDFNALLTIYERASGEQIFPAFQARIAAPLQMQDYRPRHGYYHLEPELSRHPAYPFRMSARDLARFGHLYLNQGRWQGRQLLPADWVRTSTRSHTATTVGDDYGYLWWVFAGQAGLEGGYYAAGADTQMVAVLPREGVVFVHLTDTYAGDHVSQEQSVQLLQLLLAARTGEAATSPELVDMPAGSPPAPVVPQPATHLARFAGAYAFPDGKTVDVRLDGEQLVVDFGYGRFGLLPLSPATFLVEDTRERIVFRRGPDGAPTLHYEAADVNPLRAAAAAGPATFKAPPS